MNCGVKSMTNNVVYIVQSYSIIDSIWQHAEDALDKFDAEFNNRSGGQEFYINAYLTETSDNYLATFKNKKELEKLRKKGTLPKC